ncbi:hypothetical protein RHMOL_Rhmol06G0306900 [Rhododendron molle]|uniref:Uncharacterized protein n=1 Tax=Rhododendron molle TaxID=49168 RepID=A0ACC0NI46_RHOML|nr:hypothetical protein RHMOL_Rhmol06G0306900 [Rhododendron molle]
MASSDDEGEAVPHTVSNYHFVDGNEEPISFSELPVQWNDVEGVDCEGKQIFLRGTADNGLLIYKQVTAWKFNLSDVNPEISVLSKENNWINLQKPRKSFEGIIRTILITMHFLCFVRKNPETFGGSVWDNLSKVFSFYETRPSENDLIDHTTFISEVVKRDETLANSKFLVAFLEKPGQKKALDEDNGTVKRVGFIVDDYMMDEIDEDDGSDEEVDLFDSVCAICDNGGDLLCCEGRCMRSFHATVEAGAESQCESLGFSSEQVEAMQIFFCKNCQYKQHQCFSCGELGSSDKLSGAEVFPCVSATCGRFYHPHCVAKLLHRESAADVEESRMKIAAGESFTCPIHKCIVCKQGEDKMDPDLQFAVCRRCPKSYHRKCLPRKIAFEDLDDEGIIQRAWEDLIPNRILIYCLKHPIDEEMETPIRNHITFPDDGRKKTKQASHQFPSRGKIFNREGSLARHDAPRERTLGKAQKGVELSSTIQEVDSSKKKVKRSNDPDFSKKQKVADTSSKPLNRTATTGVGKFTSERLHASSNMGPESIISSKKSTPNCEHKQTLKLDDDAKQRMLALIKRATSSITLDEIIKKHKGPNMHVLSPKHVVDKSNTLGKVEGSVEALCAALKMLDAGCSMEDAKAVCEPGLLHQMTKLRVHLAPFLHGVRYTSYGRHFTKVDKLKEIVDRLHCYVQDGDMIVDFCCGANDFSVLVKKQLDETGKKCLYRNFDLLQAKINFNFEKRDWMTVQPNELRPGSQLIMGLNPPFGVNAALANKFIDKALEFKPKLLILIVPAETERLDKKRTPYDLVWEDKALLAGKSFYLPGSVDVNDNELEDWNVNPPPLYLWSRPDWTAKHMAIAQQHGHSSRVQEKPHLEDDHDLNGQPLEDDHDLKGQPLVGIDGYLEQSELHEPLQERGASVSKIQKEGIPVGSGDSNVPGNSSRDKNQTNKYPNKKKKKRNKGKQGREFSTDRHANYGVSESHSNFQTGRGPAFAANIATGYGNSNVEGGNLGGQFGLYQRENTDSREEANLLPSFAL